MVALADSTSSDDDDDDGYGNSGTLTLVVVLETRLRQQQNVKYAGADRSHVLIHDITTEHNIPSYIITRRLLVGSSSSKIEIRHDGTTVGT